MASTAAAATARGSACREKLVSSLRKLWTQDWGLPLESRSDVGLVLSGGVDTCAVLEAMASLGLKPALAVTVLTEQATDRPYCAKLSAVHELRHVKLEVKVDELLETPLELCVRELASFDGMELRNSCVVARALQEARKLGMQYMLTGDGSDELLGGYSFTHSSEDPVWSQKRAEMCGSWFFSAPVLGQALGMQVASPFCEDEFKTWALGMPKSDCVGECEQEAAPGDTKELRMGGKLPLREAFPDAVSAWRRKDPIEVGSGSTVLGKDNGAYFNARIPAKELLEEKKRIGEELGVVIRDAEHLFYFRIFQRVFPTAFRAPPGVQPAVVAPATSSSASDSSERKVELRRLGKGDENGCLGCRFQLPTPTSNFCRICGAWPARRQSTSASLAL